MLQIIVWYSLGASSARMPFLLQTRYAPLGGIFQRVAFGLARRDVSLAVSKRGLTLNSVAPSCHLLSKKKNYP